MIKKPEWPKIPLPPAPPISPPFMRLTQNAGGGPIYIRKSHITAVYESPSGTWVQTIGDISYCVKESAHEVMDALFHGVEQ